MHNFLGNLMKQRKSYNTFFTLPEDVVTNFEITKESFSKDKISGVSCRMTEIKGMEHSMNFALACAYRIVSQFI